MQGIDEMNENIVTVHPFDPWGSKIGGIEQWIRSMIRHAPDNVTLALIGVSEDPSARPLRHWQWLEFEGRPVSFYPIMPDREPNHRSWLPLFLRFSYLLRNVNVKTEHGRFIFHRIEPILTFPGPSRQDILFVHGDPREITGPQSEVKWKYVPWLYRYAERSAIKKAARVYAVSQSGVDYFQNQYQSEQDKFVFQPTGYREDVFYSSGHVEYERNRQDIQTEHGVPADRRWILFAGRFEEQKDPLLALEAIRELSKTNADYSLLVVGTGGLEANLKERVELLNLQDRVYFLGALPPEDLADVMRGCDLFLMTSHFEGMPIAALEAQACGLPVISTAVGEIDRIVRHGETGNIVPSREPRAIAHAITAAMENPNITVERCIAAVKSFTSKRVVEEWFREMLVE